MSIWMEIAQTVYLKVNLTPPHSPKNLVEKQTTVTEGDFTYKFELASKNSGVLQSNLQYLRRYDDFLYPHA